MDTPTTTTNSASSNRFAILRTQFPETPESCAPPTPAKVSITELRVNIPVDPSRKSKSKRSASSYTYYYSTPGNCTPSNSTNIVLCLQCALWSNVTTIATQLFISISFDSSISSRLITFP